MLTDFLFQRNYGFVQIYLNILHRLGFVLSGLVLQGKVLKFQTNLQLPAAATFKVSVKINP